MNKLLISCVLTLCIHTVNAEYYGNGYTIVEGAKVNIGGDLDAIVYKNIRSRNVLGGLRELLRGSGWKLADTRNADPNIQRLYQQDYPDFKRNLNPIKLSKALQYIAGDAWDLVVDPVNKLVSFQLAEGYRCFILKEASCPALQ